MTANEAKQAFDELKAQGATEEDILGVLYMMFQDDKINLDELGSFVDILGYELSPEFLAMSPEDQKVNGVEFTDEPEEGLEGKEEEGKEIPEEGGEKSAPAPAPKKANNEEEDADDEDEEEADDEEEDEEDEEEESDDEKAAKLFGFGKK